MRSLLRLIGTTALLGTAPLTFAASSGTFSDFDGDGRDDLTVFRPSTGQWFIRSSSDGGYQVIPWGLNGDQSVSGDYDGDGVSDFAVYRESTGTWLISGLISDPITVSFGGDGDLPIPGDFDGDGRWDLAVFRPGANDGDANKVFILRSSDNRQVTFDYGFKGDIPIRGDFDGDGIWDIGIYRRSADETQPNIVALSRSQAGDVSFPYGEGDDMPIVGDFDGDGISDFGTYRPSTGAWSVFQSTLGSLEVQWGGGESDIPIPGKYDSDSKTDIAIYRNGQWYVKKSAPPSLAEGSIMLSAAPVSFGLTGDTPVFGDWNGDNRFNLGIFRAGHGSCGIPAGTVSTVPWGQPGDIPVARKWDRDNKSDVAVFRPANGTWYIRNSSGGTRTFNWGFSGATPVPGDYTGNGRANAAVFHNGTWYIRISRTRSTESAFGLPGDIPVPADYDNDGKMDVAVYRPSNGTWYINAPSTVLGSAPVQFGGPGDRPFVRDFDGNGKPDLAIYRQSSGTWHIMGDDGRPRRTRQFGGIGSTAVLADFDGDSKTDLAMYREGQWFIRDSSTGRLRVGGGPISLGGPDDFPHTFTFTDEGVALEDLIGRRGPSGGFVWKPKSEADHKLVVLISASLTDGIKAGWIADANGEVIEVGRYTGSQHNGNREHYRFSRNGGGYGANIYFVSRDRSGNLIHWPIPNGANRWDY